jgi:hypothetical protein
MALNPYAESHLNNAFGKAGKDRQPWGINHGQAPELNEEQA